MKSFEFDGVKVDVYGESGVQRQTAAKYLVSAVAKADGDIERLDVKVRGDDADLTVVYKQPAKFERIRRITGYLTGNVDTWNGAKQAELADRVKHV